jgi:hypothetical protein
LRDSEGIVLDDEGVDLPDLEAVQAEASRAMADAIREKLERPIRAGEAAIEVRDEIGHVMRVRLSIEMKIERKN